MEQYIGIGRRKSSTARCYLRPGSGKVVINHKAPGAYFSVIRQRDHALEPLQTVKVSGSYDLVVNVKGGGITGQAGAVRMGLARALVENRVNNITGEATSGKPSGRTAPGSFAILNVSVSAGNLFNKFICTLLLRNSRKNFLNNSLWYTSSGELHFQPDSAHGSRRNKKYTETVVIHKTVLYCPAHNSIRNGNRVSQRSYLFPQLTRRPFRITQKSLNIIPGTIILQAMEVIGINITARLGRSRRKDYVLA